MSISYAQFLQLAMCGITVATSAAQGLALEKKSQTGKWIACVVFAALTAASGLAGLIRMWDDIRSYSVYALLLLMSLYISYEDIMYRIVPNDYLWLIPWGMITISSWDEFAVRVIAVLVVGFVGVILALASKGKGIGGADIKFMMTSAALLGQNVDRAILIGSILSATIGVLIRKYPEGEHDSVPMIPFLCFGTIVSMLIWR